MHAAKALITDSDGHVLILRRSKTHPVWPLHDDIPGGVIEEGETPEEGVIREVFEEAGIEITTAALQLAKKTISPRGHNWFLYHVQFSDKRPEVTISWEHDKWQWLPAEDFVAQSLPENGDKIYEMAVAHVRDLQNGYKHA
jgi:8-oxo-dGTP pyrophosphatase MutT (NUDIX family)